MGLWGSLEGHAAFLAPSWEHAPSGLCVSGIITSRFPSPWWRGRASHASELVSSLIVQSKTLWGAGEEGTRFLFCCPGNWWACVVVVRECPCVTVWPPMCETVSVGAGQAGQAVVMLASCHPLPSPCNAHSRVCLQGLVSCFAGDPGRAGLWSRRVVGAWARA